MLVNELVDDGCRSTVRQLVSHVKLNLFIRFTYCIQTGNFLRGLSGTAWRENFRWVPSFLTPSCGYAGAALFYLKWAVTHQPTIRPQQKGYDKSVFRSPNVRKI